MKYSQLLKYALMGVSDQLTKEQKLADEGNGIAKARIEKIQKDFDCISDMMYMEETGQAR